MNLTETPTMITPSIEQLEEMKPIGMVRKKREQKHDFNDGHGRVPAARHANGKGWVARTAVVEDSVYIGPNCEVYHNAYVSGDVKLKGNAKIFGNSTVSGNVRVEQNGMIFGRAVVRDNVRVFNNARIMGNAHVSGNSRLIDHSTVSDGANIISSNLSGTASVTGSALIIYSYLSGRTIVCGNGVVLHATLHGNIQVRNFGQVLNRSNLQNGNSEAALIVDDYAIVTDETHVWYPVIFRQHAVVVRCRISLYGSGSPNQPPEISGNVILQGRNFNNYTDIMNAVENARNPQRNQPVVAPAIQVVQGFPVRSVDFLAAANRPRRVQRLQEVGS